MKVVKSINNIPGPISFTIGNFDGIHLGHQCILNRIKNDCLKVGHQMVVMTFVPHPQEILKGKKGFLLNTYLERRDLLEKFGVDYLVEIKFHRDFSTMNPQTFLEEEVFLNEKIKTMYLGYDFAFGQNKSGDQEIVTRYCKEKGIDVISLDQYFFDGDQVSSSKIRELINHGKVNEASRILGREYLINGNIVKGDMRGRKIGYPTANMDVSDRLIIPKNGVYVTKTKHNGKEYNSLTNIGHNPTFKPGNQNKTIEVHILEFDLEIYGETITTYFIEKIRDEIKFNSVEELIDQIKNDEKYLREKLA